MLRYTTIKKCFTNSITYGTLLGTSEILQQVIVHLYNKKGNVTNETALSVKGKPVLYCFLYGTAITGPVLYFWYQYLDRRFAGVGMRQVTAKLLCDQIIFTPISLAVFFYIFNRLDKKTHDECKQVIKKNYVKTYATACAYWPFVQFINFRFLPSRFRVVYVGGASIIWCTFLCFMKQ